MKSTMITKAILGQKTSIVSGEIHILNIVLTPLGVSSYPHQKFPLFPQTDTDT